MDQQNKDTFSLIGCDWRYYASRLARWAAQHLVNRPDIYISYLAPEKRSRGRKAVTSKGVLDHGILESHFRGKREKYIIGLHAISRSNTCRWIAIDVDCHADNTELASRNLHFAIAARDCLLQMGFQPLVMDSDGLGGLHILVLFSRPIDSEYAYRFGTWLGSYWRSLGIEEPEVFPKQMKLLNPDQCGSALRLPGRHHTRPHWTRVLSPIGDWLEGYKACRAIIETRGTPPERIPPHARSYQTEAELLRNTRIGPPRQAKELSRPTAHNLTTPTEDEFLKKPIRYLERCPPAVQGQRGDSRLWSTACSFFKAFPYLSPEQAFPLFQDWNARCQPPFSDEELWDKLRRAAARVAA